MARAMPHRTPMIPPPASTQPGPLRLERLLDVLPDSRDLRPLVEELFASSRPDPERRWTGSGELGTAGGRLVDLGAFEDRARAWVEAEHLRLERRADAVTEVIAALQRGDSDGVVAALLDESGALEAEGHSTDAEHWASAAYGIGREAGHLRTAEALRRKARCARAKGALDASARAYEEAFVRATDFGCTRDAIVAATGRGNVAIDRGRWMEAESWYGRALAILDRDDEPLLSTQEIRALRWRVYQNFGITHRERGLLTEAESWYGKAEKEAAGLDDPAADIEIQNGRGQLDLARGAPRAAELRFRKAIEAIESGMAHEVRVAIRTNLGEALLERGHTLDAAATLREAEAEALRGHHLGRLPAVYRLLARVAHERGEEQAFVLVDRALEIVRSAELPLLEEALTLQVYAELREAQGEPDAATEARERANRIFEGLGIRARPSSTHDGNGNEGESR